MKFGLKRFHKRLLILILCFGIIFLFIAYHYHHYLRIPECANLKSNNFYCRLLNDRLSQYIQLSAQAGIKPILTNNELKNVTRKNTRLQRVRSNEYFTIAKLSYSFPYLLPSAHSFLYEVAKRFNKSIAGSHLSFVRIQATSLLRTKEQQKKLQEVNENATSGRNAPHTHGTTFDISYANFSDAANNPTNLSKCEKEYLTNKLAETLFLLREKDKNIFITMEDNKQCFHIVVCE
jgi:hypothetical protein